MESAGDGHNGTHENRHDTPPDVVRGNGERTAVSSSSAKNEGMSKRHRETTEDEEEPTPAVTQVEGHKAVFSEPPTVKGQEVDCGAFKLSR